MVSTGDLDSTQMTFEEDGRFEILVSAKEQKGNWLPMKQDSNMIIVRQTFQDRPNEVPAMYEIECLDPSPDTLLDVGRFEEQMMAAVNFVSNTANIFVDWMEEYEQHLNQLPSDDQERCQRAGGDANIHYLQSHWRLGPEEALLIEADRIPEKGHWNLQISNFWMESLDYRHHRIHVNKHTAHYEDDGSVRLVVSHSDPGVPNWIETAGHNMGTMCWRWIGADRHPLLETRVAKLADL